MINQRFGRTRRALLPWWMTAFIWIFILLTASSILFRVFKLFGIVFWFGSGESSIYGMSTYDSFSLLGIFIGALLIFKGVTAFAMWTEKDWAIKFGILDACIGIAICIIMTFIQPIFENIEGKNNINFRFELLLLIPYLIKCIQLQKIWTQEPDISIDNSSILVSTPQVTVTVQQETETIVEEKENSSTVEEFDKEDPRRFMPK